MLKPKNKLVGRLKQKSTLKGKLNHAIKHEYPSLKNLEVTPTKEQQVFNHENGYGYDEVTVNPIPNEYSIPTGTLTITKNGEHNVKEYERVITDIREVSKYSPRAITFNSYSGTDLIPELEALDTSNITNMTNMFYYCQKLNSLDLSYFNTSNVTRMTNMFQNCSSLTSVDLSSFDTKKVDSMQQMFSDCKSLTSLDLSNFNTENVTSFYSMFYQNTNLTSLDLSSFNTENVTNMLGMFSNCISLKYLDIRNFTFNNVSSYSNIFANIPVDCEIIVKDDIAREWVLARRSDFTNVKTVSELEMA